MFLISKKNYQTKVQIKISQSFEKKSLVLARIISAKKIVFMCVCITVYFTRFIYYLGFFKSKKVEKNFEN